MKPPEDRDGPLGTDEEIRAFLGVSIPGPTPGAWMSDAIVAGAGYRLDRGSYAVADGDDVPALLLRPRTPTGAGVVVFHQHNREWHLKKREVAGLAGDPLQAVGRTLAAAGVTVMSPDAVGFEDRRSPAVSLLTALDEVDPRRVGAVGHSFGGQTVLFSSAIDPRVRFACASGAAASYRARMEQGIPIGYGHVVPGIARRMDFDTLVACTAPRPLLLVAGSNDRWAVDAQDVADRARQAYEDADASGQLRCEVLSGGHPLTPERHALVCDWTLAAAGQGHEVPRTGGVRRREGRQWPSARSSRLRNRWQRPSPEPHHLIGSVHGKYDRRIDHGDLRDDHVQRAAASVFEHELADAIVVVVDLDDLVVRRHRLDLGAPDVPMDHLARRRSRSTHRSRRPVVTNGEGRWRSVWHPAYEQPKEPTCSTGSSECPSGRESSSGPS